MRAEVRDAGFGYRKEADEVCFDLGADLGHAEIFENSSKSIYGVVYDDVDVVVLDCFLDDDLRFRRGDV